MSIFELGPFRLDPERLLLLDGADPVPLGPKVVETLLALVEYPGTILTKAALIDRVWPDGYIGEANLAQNIYVLRKTLRAKWSVLAIETIPRRGYRFVADVRRREASAAPVVAALRRSPQRWLLAAAACLALVLTGGVALSIALPREGATRPGLSAEGARLYAIGRYYWNLRTPEGIAKSKEYFRRVVDRDPRSALGYAALASADVIAGDYGYGSAAPKVDFAQARAYARKAIDIDPNSGEAYAVLGLVSEEHPGANDRLAQAVSDLRRAIRIDPKSGPAREWYGLALLDLGRVDEAYGQLRKAADLDPLSVATVAWLGDVAYLGGHYAAAIAYAREALDLSPQRTEAYETLGLAYEAQGDRQRAVDTFFRLADACSKCKAQAAALLAGVYARGNRKREARAELAIARAHANDVPPEDLAAALAALGQRSVALSWLRHLNRNFARAEIANDPRFDLLRGDPKAS